MSTGSSFSKLKVSEESELANTPYQYINVFKNPNKLPITQIHLERSWRQLKKDIPGGFDFLNKSSQEIEKAYFEKKTEVIPALDERWLPKAILHTFCPYSFCQGKEENASFILKNSLYLDTLDYLLNCNYHQFWCIILFDASAAITLRSFLLSPMLPFQSKYLEDEYMAMYATVFKKFLLVYDKLLTFKQSEIEHMSKSFGLSKLIDRKLLNLPIVITLAVLYRDSDLTFVNKVTELYFNHVPEVEFVIKEVETCIDQNSIILEMIGGYVCGFDESAVIVPIAINKRPPVFSLSWVCSVVNYLLCTLLTSSALFHFYKPAVEVALNKNFPYRLPFIYVNVYRELYELINEREEAQTKHELFKMVIDGINMGRAEFVELYHIFVSNCLDEALKHMGDGTRQEEIVETYLKLLTTALEDEYFICDYNAVYDIATQNEMFESCCDIDPTRTEFIVSCINKFPRNKTLQELSKLKPQTIERVFRDFAAAMPEERKVIEPQPGPSEKSNGPTESETDEKIKSIMDMFPDLGDGFVLQCLESYNFNTSDVINAILENNLPPHLSQIPFDTIRIPPEPEPEKPVLAYKGKKPGYDDALQLLNDKKEIQDIKNLVLEGVQYNYDYIYDDEYDDRDNDDVSIPVPDNPVTEVVQTFNPNRQNRNKEPESDDDDTSEDEASGGPSSNTNKNNFCEDPAVLRERREAKFRSRQPSGNNIPPKPKGDVVGKPKGQGQDKNTLINRQKKNVNKSSRANHNRKGGAQWKRSKGMVPI